MTREWKLTYDSLRTGRLPEGVLEYAVWVPPGYKTGQTLPLIINLHSGSGSRGNLGVFSPVVEAVTKAGDFPDAVWPMPSAGRSFYMDFEDGTADRESVIDRPSLFCNIPTSRKQYLILSLLIFDWKRVASMKEEDPS
ncbi:MAG: hypothetical protein V3S89_08520 [Desulfobacterales bacterium]